MNKKYLFLIIMLIFPLCLIITGCNLFEETKYEITLNSPVGVTITSDKNLAKTGELITLSYEVQDGVEFKKFIVNSSYITGNTFNMPNHNVNVSAEVQYNNVITYNIDQYTTNTNPTTYTTGYGFTLENPSKQGYDFLGWYQEPEFINKVSEISNDSFGVIVLYPKFEAMFTVLNNKITGLTTYAKSIEVNNLIIPNQIDGENITGIALNSQALNIINKNLTFGNNIKIIGANSFLQYIEKLDNIYYTGTLSDWVTMVVDLTSAPMKYTKNLYINGQKIEENLTIPKSITQIKNYAFYGFEQVENVLYEGTVEDWLKISFGANYSSPLMYGKLLIDGTLISGTIRINDINYVQPYAFMNCKEITEVILEDTVKYIGTYAFYGCRNLKSINLEEVVNIYSYAFFNCLSLKSVTLTLSQTIGDSAFECSGLTSASFGIYTTTIGNSAFSLCELDYVLFKFRIETIGDFAFSSNKLTTVVFDGYTNLKSIGTQAFSHNDNLEVDLSGIGENVSLGESVFENYNTKTLKLYFKDQEMIDLYKTKTYWKYYSSYMYVKQ